MARMMPRWREPDLRCVQVGDRALVGVNPRRGQFGYSGHTTMLSQVDLEDEYDLEEDEALYGYISQVDLEDEYIDMPDLEDPDEDEVVYVAAGGDNLLYGGLAEEGIIYYEVNRQGSLHPHAHHLAAEQFVQARFRYEVNRRGSLHTHAHLLYMRPNTSSKATAP